ncbi:AI-2E family transporter [Thiomonas sp. FB-Cd]|uniref:AI-2E family transporter n=1 Tax=Thiomonas sp. FB-Cd TaxID=1158292 RepID=UPI0004DF66AF|nr:AI-2E family transporter [Thiomonas sp. FB-Cd]
MSRRLDPWVLAFLAGLGLVPFAPFAVPIVAGMALAAASLPLQRRLESRMPAWMAASIVTALWLAMAVLPVVAIVSLLAPLLPALKQASLNPDALIRAATQAPWVGALVASHQDAVRAWIAHNQPDTVLTQHLADLRVIGARLATLALHAALALAVLWAVLTRRAQVAGALQHSLRRVVSKDLASRIEGHALRSTQAVMLGMVALALWEGLLTMPLFALTGLPSWFAWGVAIGMLSAVPGGTGAALVLATALLGAQGHIAAALAVLVLGHVITMTGDFIVKPEIIGATSHAPFLLVLLAIFGGVEVFGLVGLILGPVLVLTAQALVFDD